MQTNLIEFIKKIKPQYKLTFLSTIIFGIISQGMGLFNKYSWHDDISALFSVGSTYTSGRWMLDLLGKFEVKIFGDGHYSLPVVNGVFSILCIGLSACIIIGLMEIKSQILCISIGGVMVTFPVVTGLFGYMFTVPYYMLGMLAGVFGAYCVCKWQRWYALIPGVILMGCSVGVYQAFIPVVLSMFLFWLIKRIYEAKEEEIALLLKKVVTIGLSCGLFILFYFWMTYYFINKYGVKLATDQGIDRMGKASLHEYILRVSIAYREFFAPSMNSNYYMFPGSGRIVHTILVAAFCFYSLILLLHVYRESKINVIIMAVLISLVPITVNFIFVMVAPGIVHSLMVYGQAMFFVIFAWLIENIHVKREKFNSIINKINIVFAGILFFVIIMYCRFDNICYLKASFSQEEAISYFTTLITRIKSADGYTDELPVVFVNANNINDKSLENLESLNYVNIIPYSGVTSYVNDWAWIDYMHRWCGYYPLIGDVSMFSGIPEVERMPSYPDDGSIKIINDTVVVKF